MERHRRLTGDDFQMPELLIREFLLFLAVKCQGTNDRSVVIHRCDRGDLEVRLGFAPVVKIRKRRQVRKCLVVGRDPTAQFLVQRECDARLDCTPCVSDDVAWRYNITIQVYQVEDRRIKGNEPFELEANERQDILDLKRMSRTDEAR